MKFDPQKCDHGAVLFGRSEWDWCENCRPAVREDFDPSLCPHNEWNDGMPLEARETCPNCEAPRVRVLTPAELADDDEIASLSALNDPTW